VLGIRDILVRIRILLLMDLDPDLDPTPDPTPFFTDFKGTQDWEFFDSDFEIRIISLLVMSKY
jgi:hypothetical protein